MQVGIVMQVGKADACGVIEVPSGVHDKEVLRHWVASQGLREEAIKNFYLNCCSVVPWSYLSTMFIPYSDVLNTKGHNNGSGI